MTKKSLKDKKSKPNSAKKGKSAKNKHPQVYDGLKHQAKVQKNVEKHIAGETLPEKKEIPIEKPKEKPVDLSIPNHSDIQKVKYNSALEKSLKEILKQEIQKEDKESLEEEFEKNYFLIMQFENYGFKKEEILQKIQQEKTKTFLNIYKSLTGENFDYDKEELEGLIDDEITVLESIFESKMKCSRNENIEVLIFSEYESVGQVGWNFIIKTDSVYPMELPIVEIIGDFNDKETSKLKKAIHKYSMDYIGTAMIYSIITYLDENLHKILNQENKSETRMNSYLKEMKNSKYSFDQLNNPWRMGISEKKQKEKVDFKENVEIKKTEISQNAIKIDEEILKKREQLPSYKMKDEIVKTIEKNQVTIISGATGCGKTTQIPQFILDYFPSSNLICTQPRRISAISVSERVAFERGQKIGKEIGYSIRLESKRSNETKLLFCTTGVLLRTLENDPFLQDITHLVIDEIHERSVESDFLLIVMKDILKKRKHLKLILMSATLNSELFSHYFKCPIIEIEGRTFPVKRFYLEDIYRLVSPNNIKQIKQIEDEKNIKYLDEQPIDTDIIIQLVKYICKKDEGGILIFLPGIQEIMKLYKQLLQEIFIFQDKKKFNVIPLHSSLSSFDQHLVFDVPPKGVRKIILSTNIAETSVTIDDIVYVIDTGKMKEMQYDSERGMSCLVECMVSKANSKQRAGRAGRVKEGNCYHLYTKYREKFLPENQDPEMLRTPLEQLCLKIIHLELGDVKSFLSRAIDPPAEESIDFALKTLQNLYAIDSETLKLTPLGYHLATLPVDARLGKMILFGTIFKCLDPILTIAASTSVQSPFTSPFNKQEEAYNAKKKFGVEKSDHLTLLKAFNQWQEATKEKKEKEFCRDNYLSGQTLKMILDMKKQFVQLLKTIGFIQSSYSMNDRINENSNNLNIINSVICAGLYPNIVYISPPKYEDQPPKFYIKNGIEVFIHPSSILHNDIIYDNNYLIYQEIVKTSKIYVRSASVVTPYPLILFSEKMQIQGDCVVLDGWILFKMSKDIANLLRELRVEMVKILVDKLKNPNVDISSSKSSELMDGLMNMIQNEFCEHLNVELK